MMALISLMATQADGRTLLLDWTGLTQNVQSVTQPVSHPHAAEPTVMGQPAPALDLTARLDQNAPTAVGLA